MTTTLERDPRLVLQEEGLKGIARAGYDRLREPGVAEVAFTVADDFQGRGAASRLLEQLAQIATDHGISRFDAEVLTDNMAMLRVFKRAGFDIRRRNTDRRAHLQCRRTTAAAHRARRGCACRHGTRGAAGLGR